eukprot:6214492-Pleurochrysis_carterae.AAC.1
MCTDRRRRARFGATASATRSPSPWSRPRSRCAQNYWFCAPARVTVPARHLFPLLMAFATLSTTSSV